MTATIKRWLAQRLDSIDSIQKSVVSQEPDIVVHSWSGVLVHVHVVDAPLKPRALKRTVQEATRVGIGSLFVVNRSLLPPDGARLMPADWLMMLHALTDDKIYAYHLADSGPCIQQVHFQMTTKSDEREVWYGPNIEIGQLPFFRVWVKTSLLKGDFLVANFGAPAFWHNRDYRNARQQAADEARRANRTYTRVEYGFGSSAPAHRVQPTPLDVALAHLGLKPGASCEEVKSAFRRLALEIHPDVSALPKQEAENRFRELNDAYNYIRDHSGCA
jgi:molecular chaperone DnaJ